MRFSGTNTLLLPQVLQNNFAINNIVVQTTGLSSIQFLDNSNNVYAINMSGNRIARVARGTYTNISTYNVNEAFSISGYYNTLSFGRGSYITHYVNDILTRQQINGSHNGMYSLSINVAPGDTLDCDITMVGNNINYGFEFEPSYQGGSTLTGYFTSDTNFWVFSSTEQFLSSFQPMVSGPSLTGMVGPSNPLPIVFQDIDDSTQEYDLSFLLQLNTTLGTINTTVSSERTGILDNSYSYLFMDLNSSNLMSGEFDGDWSANTFTYVDTPQYITMNYFYTIRDGNGNPIDDNVTVSLTPVSPLNSGAYTASYITGFNITNSGYYLYPPTASFTDYYYVTGVQQNIQSMLFSSSCVGNLPVTFTNVNGTGAGASGNLMLTPIILNNIYGVGNSQFYIVQAFSMATGGTGYTLPPTAVVHTGNFAGCYDVPAHYGYAQALFTPFNTVGALNPLASYLTGWVMTTTGIVSGGATGYYVTGLDMGNIGSGYSAAFVPQVQFIRQAGDTQTNNASGYFPMKSTGMYNFPAVWSLQTGYPNVGFAPMSGLSGTFFTNGSSFFSVQVGVSGLDNTQPVVVQLNITPTLTGGVIDIITGTKFFDTDPYSLKKNINVEETLIPPTADLTFLLSQTDLDQYYSSSAYLGNTLDVGDLDF